MVDSDQHIEFEGVVTNSVKGVLTVDIDTGSSIQCYIGGKMRRNKINIVVGDKVRVKVSVYDTSKGIITYRL